MSDQSCHTYYYYNSTTESCELCWTYQVEFGIVSWCLVGLLAILCCSTANSPLMCPLAIVLIIAVNQAGCDRQWDNRVANTLVLVDTLMLLVAGIIVNQQCNYDRTVYLHSTPKPNHIIPSTNLSKNPVAEIV